MCGGSRFLQTVVKDRLEQAPPWFCACFRGLQLAPDLVTSLIADEGKHEARGSYTLAGCWEGPCMGSCCCGRRIFSLRWELVAGCQIDQSFFLWILNFVLYLESLFPLRDDDTSLVHATALISLIVSLVSHPLHEITGVNSRLLWPKENNLNLWDKISQ